MTTAPARRAPPMDPGVLMPHDLRAEMAALGTFLAASDLADCYRVVATGLEPADFFRASHQALYAHLLGMLAREEPTDAVTVWGSISANGGIKGVEPVYLSALLESVPATANGAYYARIVIGHARRRCGIEAADRAVQQLGDLGSDLDATLTRLVADVGAAVAPQGTAAPALRAKVLGRSALAMLPRPQPLVKDTIDRRTVALLAGAPAVGKSLIALSWACCVATGMPWLGRAVERGRVLYIAAEGAFGLDARIGAWETAVGVTADEGWLDVLPEPVQLLDGAAVSGLVELVAAERYRLVVVDTFARSIVGADENSAKDVGIAVEALERVRRATDDTTVLLVHHTGKDRTTVRGSSALEAAVDTVYAVDGDPALIKLLRTKRKEGPRDDELTLRLLVSADSVTIESHFDLGTDRELAESEARLLKIFRDSFGTTGATGTQLRDVADMPKSSHYRALNVLLNRGALRNDGTQQRPFYVLGGTVA